MNTFKTITAIIILILLTLILFTNCAILVSIPTEMEQIVYNYEGMIVQAEKVEDILPPTIEEVEKFPEIEEEVIITIGMKNAVETAKDYIRWFNPSKQGLIEFLQAEDFTEEEINYAIEQVWK